MLKKISQGLFVLSLPSLLATNLVGCGLKQEQLPFQIKDWNNSWILNNANMWQSMAKMKNNAYLPNFPGLFLDDHGVAEDLDNVHKKISDSKPIKPPNGGLSKRKSPKEYPETFLQLDWFLPNLIYTNEIKYSRSALHDWAAIDANFEITYLEAVENNDVAETNRTRLSFDHFNHRRVEMILESSGTYERLQSYFKIQIRLRNPEPKLIGDIKVQASCDGYYIDINKPQETTFSFIYAPYITFSLF